MKLCRVLSTPRWRSALLRHGVAAGVEHCSVLSRVGEISTVVDIGANRGQFALTARRQLPDAAIFSFEPLEQPADVYREVFRGDERVEIREAAIGPNAGEVEIHVSGRDDSSSLLPIGELQSAIFPGTSEIGTAIITVAPLTDLLSAASVLSPALLKLDVQGYELEALKGCEPLLHRFEWVYAECSFIEMYVGQALVDAVIAWLRERDLIVAGIYNLKCDRRHTPVQADFLFRRRMSDS